MIPFLKLHGLGNDFVFLEAETFLSLPGGSVRRLCHRTEGVGADGVITVDASRSVPLMRMWNPDGSESEMCGNGLRCAALFLDITEGCPQSTRSISLGGKNHVIQRLSEGMYQVDMGPPSFDPESIGLNSPNEWVDHLIEVDGFRLVGTAVAIGNPHWVFFVDDEPRTFLPIGQTLEHHPAFRNRTNVHFARVVNNQEVDVATWERGAGVTLACGSGACAVVAAGERTGRLKPTTSVRLGGGVLSIDLTAGSAKMTGPAARVFSGNWPV